MALIGEVVNPCESYAVVTQFGACYKKCHKWFACSRQDKNFRVSGKFDKQVPFQTVREHTEAVF